MPVLEARPEAGAGAARCGWGVLGRSCGHLLLPAGIQKMVGEVLTTWRDGSSPSHFGYVVETPVYQALWETLVSQVSWEALVHQSFWAPML